MRASAEIDVMSFWANENQLDSTLVTIMIAVWLL